MYRVVWMRMKFRRAKMNRIRERMSQRKLLINKGNWRERKCASFVIYEKSIFLRMISNLILCCYGSTTLYVLPFASVFFWCMKKVAVPCRNSRRARSSENVFFTAAIRRVSAKIYWARKRSCILLTVKQKFSAFGAVFSLFQGASQCVRQEMM